MFEPKNFFFFYQTHKERKATCFVLLFYKYAYNLFMLSLTRLIFA